MPNAPGNCAFIEHASWCAVIEALYWLVVAVLGPAYNRLVVRLLYLHIGGR